MKVIIFQRAWQAFAGVLTIFFLSKYLTLVEQGWYFSFISFSAFYALFDLGLSSLLVPISAHIFAHGSKIDPSALKEENCSEFLSFFGQSSRLYLRLGILFFFLITPLGIFFFAPNFHHIYFYTWVFPWVVLTGSVSINLISLPFFSVLEGVGLVEEVYLVRFLQGCAGSIALWLSLSFGYGLWSIVSAPLTSIVVFVIWVFIRHSYLLRYSWKNNILHFDWSKEVSPLRWRVGLNFMSGFLLTQIYTPIIFRFHGAEAAGQMGLSLTIANMLGLLSQSWMAYKVPVMAKAAKKRDWVSLDSIFKKEFLLSIFFYIFGVTGIFALYYILIDTVYINRVLQFWSFGGLMIVVLINHIIGSLTTQLRSYKKEPLFWVSVLGAFLTVPVAIISAMNYSVSGVVFSILFVQIIVTTPLTIYLWVRYNKELRM